MTKNLNKNSNDYYKNLSNFGKTLSTNLQNDSIQQFKYYPCDKNLFYTVLLLLFRLLQKIFIGEVTSNLLINLFWTRTSNLMRILGIYSMI
jgi:hypothetical protein